MQNLTTETPQSQKIGKTERRHRSLLISLIFLIVLLISVAIYFIICASFPRPKPGWWMIDFCFRLSNWNVRA